jgi:hypothetical protein
MECSLPRFDAGYGQATREDTMTNTTLRCALAAPFFALAACGGIRDEEHVDDRIAERTAYEEMAIAGDTSTGYRSSAPAPVVPVPGSGTTDGPLTATGNFQGVAEGFPPGSLTIVEDGPNATRFSIVVQRYAAGAPLEFSVVRGDCRAGGQVVRVIGQAQVPESGIVSQDYTVQLPTRTVMDGQHSVRIANPVRAGDPLVVLACADIPPAPRG